MAQIGIKSSASCRLVKASGLAVASSSQVPGYQFTGTPIDFLTQLSTYRLTWMAALRSTPVRQILDKVPLRR